MVTLAPLLLAGSLCTAAALAAGALPAPGVECECSGIFDDLVARIEADYVGFHVAIKGARLDEWRAFVRGQRERAAAARGEDCVTLLQGLAEWFGDGHLFVSEQGGTHPPPAPETISIPDEELDRITTAGGARAEVEGIWYSKEGPEYAVLRDPTGRRDFVAVLLDDGAPGWEAGEVKAEFWSDARDGLRVRYRADDHSIRHYRARVWRGLLLHMAPVTWGRRLPLARAEEDELDAHDPRAPTARILASGTVYVSIPSHSPEYAAALDALVELHREALANAALLILDLRGNEGGSSGTSRTLAPFYEGRPRSARAAPLGDAVVLSSPDNVAYFRAMIAQGWIPPGLVARMEAHPGELVAFEDSVVRAASDAPASVGRASARRVAVLIDGGVVSAGEAFTLELSRFENVTLFGQNTGGMIDYQNVTLVPLACPESGLFLGYPTIAVSDRLPLGGLNATGIAPEVRIESSVEDWVRFVVEHERGR